MPCKVVIPSRKRAGRILTKVKNAILYIDQAELSEYRRCYPDIEIETHPGLNRLSLIRQAIYKRFSDVFMIDDDIQDIYRLYPCKDKYLSPTDAYKAIQYCYETAKEIGAHLFGFNNSYNPRDYNAHKPFMLKGYINGSAMGLIKSDKLYFTEKTTAAESHWINLLNAFHYRYCFIDKRYCFMQAIGSTFKRPGGQTGRRTLQSEKEDTLFLMQNFGSSVRWKKARNKTKQLHEYQRELNIKL